MENSLEFWLKKLNCNQKELSKYLSVTEQQISNRWKHKGIPLKYIPQLEKILIEGQHNVVINNVNNSGYIDSRVYSSESPDVLKHEISKLDNIIVDKEEQVRTLTEQVRTLTEQVRTLTSSLAKKDEQITKLIEAVTRIK